MVDYGLRLGRTDPPAPKDEKDRSMDESGTGDQLDGQQNTSPRSAAEPTRAANAAVAAQLPFDDRQAFDDAHRGFVAALDPPVITGASGRTVWSLEPYDFLRGEAPDTVNPSLWRMAQLNQIHGLFTVRDKIHQVRGYDLSNMTVIEGTRGYIVIDPLISAETAAAGMQLVRQQLGDRPVTAVIYTHSHLDHFGGAQGIIDFHDVNSGEVPVVAPAGFTEHAISENIYAGNAMSRRSIYMYGPVLPPGPRGQISAGLGVTTSRGTSSLVPPTTLIDTTGTELVLDGVRFVFQYTPDSEAPAEMTFHLPDMRALCMAENVSHVMHNLYTLRGAEIRDARAWSFYLDEAIEMFGDMTDVMFISHHWPVWGSERVIKFIQMQRDLYKFIHDETLRFANHGYTMVEIAEMVQLPDKLAQFWANRGLYGSLNHNIKAVYQKYLGWFDGNPANLHPLTPADAGARYVELAGGAAKALAHARAAHNAGDYRWTVEVVKHVLAANPDNEDARQLQADAFEQLGYQAESAPWRNFYLSGAHELRLGVSRPKTTRTTQSGITDAMTTDLFLDFLGIRFNGLRAPDLKTNVNLLVTDTSERYLLTIGNGVLIHTKNKQSSDAALTLHIDRETLGKLTGGIATLDTAIADRRARIDGDRTQLDELLSCFDDFELWFNLVTPNPHFSPDRP